MPNDNLKLWEQVCTTDKAYTKAKTDPYPHTDINATYMFQRATEAFGPLGQGWGYTVEGLDWRDNGLVVVKLLLWHKWNGERSEPVHVIGSKLAEYDTVARQNKPSRHVLDDEAAKKACTDAIKKWLSMLGVCSDVYMGELDNDHGGGTETASRPSGGGGGMPRGAAAGGGPACPKCGAAMRLRKRKSDGAPFWSCSKYPDCKGTVDASEPDTKAAEQDDQLSDDDIPF